MPHTPPRGRMTSAAGAVLDFVRWQTRQQGWSGADHARVLDEVKEEQPGQTRAGATRPSRLRARRRARSRAGEGLRTSAEGLQSE